ncbi:uncharacterized protein LOC143258707 isoform X2 [Tachypleus tridentatus]|uniref:uncharacterized protein LOC143258707 isoform X2 n=1 Tax=Tachypleus tridentatus TaxID=6853 RepID=UPI003FD2AE7B
MAHNISYSRLGSYCLPLHLEQAAAFCSTFTVGVQTGVFMSLTQSFLNQVRKLLLSVVKRVQKSISMPISIPIIPSSGFPDPLPLTSASGVSSGPSSSLVLRWRTIICSNPELLESSSTNRDLLAQPRAGSTEVDRPNKEK